MKILVIGNGSTGIDILTNKAYINNHTAHFLTKVRETFHVGFSQFTTVYNQNSNLQNFDITSSDISNHNLPSKKNPFFLIKLIRIILQYDFIYIFYPGSLGTLVGVLAKLVKKPYGLYVRGEYFINNRFDKGVLKKSKFIFTISPAFVPQLMLYCKNVDVIKPMISITEKDIKRDREYIHYTTTKFLFVGRVEKDKGIYELIDIACQLKNKGHDFVLNIIGGGDLYEETLDLIEEKTLTKHVFLHGLVTDTRELKAFYDTSNIFLFTSHHEGFPRVLYEAMASGLPIFTTFVGGISGRMKHLDNCIEIPVKDGQKATEIITEYIDDKKLLKDIGEKGIETIEYIIDGSLLNHEELLLKEINNEK